MKFSHIIEQSPSDWKTTMRQNEVLTIFHTQIIYHLAWKTVKTTLQCIVGLQLRGEGHENEKKLWDKSVFIGFLAFQTFSPWLENNKTSKCDSESFPHMVTYILCVENCQSYILTDS